MRDFFASAAPEDLYMALAAHDWDVPAACAAFIDNGDGRHNNHNNQRIDVEGGSAAAAASTGSVGRLGWDRTRSSLGASGLQQPAPHSRFKLWFDGVADELKGRYRGPFLPRSRERYYRMRRSSIPAVERERHDPLSTHFITGNLQKGSHTKS